VHLYLNFAQEIHRERIAQLERDALTRRLVNERLRPRRGLPALPLAGTRRRHRLELRGSR
jgi:hypothetical protein